MPSFKSILPFWRHVGAQPVPPAHHVRTRPLPKSFITGTRHELMFDPLMRQDEETPRHEYEEHGRLH